MRHLTPRTADGRPLYAIGKADTPRRQIYTHDWTDPTTWFSEAERITNEATTHATGATWSLAHDRVIDTYHGKLFGEDYLTDANGHSFRVAVTVDGVAKTECDPHSGTGDFTVNYDAGSIAFTGTPPASNADVRVTYHHENGGSFIVGPSAGKRLAIDVVEVQFSADIEILDTVRFQVWVYAPAELCAAMGWPLGTKVPYGDAAVYKTIKDYYADAMRAYPAYPALGGAGWRGIGQGMIIFDWDYLAQIPLATSTGAEIRVSLDHDTPFGGAYATASFYCTEEDE